MAPHYRHTQTGWVILVSLLGAAALMLVLLAGARELPGAWLAALVLVAAGVLFATLTVEVDTAEVRVSFTGGIVRRRVALTDVSRYREVRNPWYYGWGIHKLPGGWIWNVSGYDAVELMLRSGSVWRIGTDEPEALARAIAAVAPATAATGEASSPAVPSRRRGPWYAVALGVAILAGAALFVAPFWLQTRDPEVDVTPQRLSIGMLFYGQDYPLDDVTDVSLEPRLPRILARTNGFAGGGYMRGWFRIEGLGRGKLFVDLGSPPFVVARLREGFVAVNFSDPERTRALYDAIQSRRAARAAAAGGEQGRP